VIVVEKDAVGMVGNFGQVTEAFSLRTGRANYGDPDVMPARAADLYDFTDCEVFLVGETAGRATDQQYAVRMTRCVRNRFFGTVEDNLYGGLLVEASSKDNEFFLHNEFNNGGSAGAADIYVKGNHNRFVNTHAWDGIVAPHQQLRVEGVGNTFDHGELGNVTIEAGASKTVFRGTLFQGTFTDNNGTTTLQGCTGYIDDGFGPASIAPTYAGSFVNAGGGRKAGGYWRDHVGYVHLEGAVSGGAVAPTTIFTLPAGYRPTATQTFFVNNVSLGGGAQVQIASTGVVTLETGAAGNIISLSGIYFKAA
jgi:hypothetical protein